MRKVVETLTCDIDTCGSEMNVKNESVQVIFTTEQTEGRYSEPYLQLVKIELCDYCKSKLLKGTSIFASGAMGHNQYYFKS